jgi:uncharacterized iron-regulated membrane protein
MKKMLRKIHLWIAFPAGLIITILCLTGAILVFRAELEDRLYPERYFVEDVTAEKLPLHELMPQINRQLDNDVATAITVSRNPKRTYAVTIASNFHNPQFADPYSGKLIRVEGGASFFSQLLQLHRWLLIGRQTGAKITGWSTLLLVVILISGTLVVIPKSRKGMKRILTVSVTKGWKRFWYDLHLSAGTYALLILLLLSLTALTWSFRWYSNGVYKLFGVEQSVGRPSPNGANNQQQGGRGQREGGRGGRPGSNRPVDFTHWQAVFDEVAAENPNYQTISIRNGTATVTRQKIWGNVRASDQYTFDEKTGEITGYQPYGEQAKAMKIRGWLYTLHVGAWGGLFSKIITCLASLVGASLPLTGYYIWIMKQRKRRMKDK